MRAINRPRAKYSLKGLLLLHYLLFRNAATDTIDQELLFAGQESGKLLALKQIIQKGFQPPILIFVQSKDRAKELFNELIYDGLNIDVIHAERTQTQVCIRKVFFVVKYGCCIIFNSLGSSPNFVSNIKPISAN